VALTITLTQLRTNLRYLLDDPNGRVYTDAPSALFLNLARDHVVDQIAHWGGIPLVARATISIVADTIEYNLPDSNEQKSLKWIQKVTILRDDSTERRIPPIEWKDSEDYSNPLQTPSLTDVLAYYRQGYKIGFLPKPKRAETAYVYHTSVTADLATGSDVLVMPSWVRDLVLFRAAEIAAASKGDQRTADRYAGLYQKTYQGKLLILSEWQDQETSSVRSLWETDYSTFTDEP
jgi:hypothetical protein